MISYAKARAHANIALIKYWGKASVGKNTPATPSIALALEALTSETEIRPNRNGHDTIYLNGKKASGKDNDRVVGFLDYLRKQNLIEGHFNIASANNFPTGAGLASSASGFAALVKGLSKYFSAEISDNGLSQLARIGSGSAARSITGGMSALPTGQNPASKLIIPADNIPWGMVIVTVGRDYKLVSSREGMERTRKSSPFYRQWLKQAAHDYRKMLTALKKRDFDAIGSLMEANCMAMHACVMAARPPILYWNRTTFEIINCVLDWRKRDLFCYFTTDAGPQVIILGRLQDLNKIARRAMKIPGVADVIKSRPGNGAEIVAWK